MAPVFVNPKNEHAPRATTALSRVPSLSQGVRLRADGGSGWLLHSTARAMRLSDAAAVIVSLIDGVRSVADIARVLRKTYQGGIDTLDADVLVLVRVLLSRGLVMLRGPAVSVAMR